MNPWNDGRRGWILGMYGVLCDWTKNGRLSLLTLCTLIYQTISAIGAPSWLGKHDFLCNFPFIKSWCCCQWCCCFWAKISNPFSMWNQLWNSERGASSLAQSVFSLIPSEWWSRYFISSFELDFIFQTHCHTKWNIIVEKYLAIFAPLIMRLAWNRLLFLKLLSTEIQNMITFFVDYTERNLVEAK